MKTQQILKLVSNYTKNSFNQLKLNFLEIKHRKIWFGSMIGMTYGFFATLIVGTIIALIGRFSSSNIFVSISNFMSYITCFGIGIGVGVYAKLPPLKVLATGLGTFIAGQSLFIPILQNGNIIFNQVQVNINLNLITPGDVFGAWLASVLWLYFFKIYKAETKLDIFLIPLIGIFIGVFTSLFLTYLTTFVIVVMQLVIYLAIDTSQVGSILLSPIVGGLMGLALSLPTSSAAIAFALSLDGNAAISAIGGTAGQMISFGMMTYFFTRKIGDGIAVGFGSSMLQIRNYTKKPILLLIPLISSMTTALLNILIFRNTLPYIEPSVTSGMGTALLYGQIFTLIENNGIANAWFSVVFVQLIFPALLTLLISYGFKHKNWIQKDNLILWKNT